MPKPQSPQTSANNAAQPVTKENYLTLANFLEGKDRVQRVQKKDNYGEALRDAAESYGNREYVAAYENFKPAYDKVVSDMQRVLARNVEFEANKLARQLRKPLAVAKESVQNTKVYAQQVLDAFDRLMRDLENKALVRLHIKKRANADAAAEPSTQDSASTTINSASETRIDAPTLSRTEVAIDGKRYTKAPYLPPEIGNLYCVRDKAKSERIIRVLEKSTDGKSINIEILEDGHATSQPIKLTGDSLARQATKGWCNLLVPFADDNETPIDSPTAATASDTSTMTRLDIQNFGRCCGDIVRAKINFDTQRIKDVGDGPFRAGDYEHAFLSFEQFASAFNSAVANSRRAIADGRRQLTSEKGKLSGKEIQERTAAYTRSEQLIHTAEREFATILEGLRMYLRAQQKEA